MRAIVFLLIFNTTWALKDRALFSVNNFVYFFSDYNSLVNAKNTLNCAGLVENLNLYIDDESKLAPLNVSKDVLSYDAVKNVERVALLVQLFSISSSHSFKQSSVNLKDCPSKNVSKEYLFKLLKANDYLAKRILTSKSNKESMRKTLDLFKKTTVKRVEYRSFY